MQIKFILSNKNSKLNNFHYKMNVFKKKTINIKVEEEEEEEGGG